MHAGNGPNGASVVLNPITTDTCFWRSKIQLTEEDHFLWVCANKPTDTCVASSGCSSQGVVVLRGRSLRNNFSKIIVVVCYSGKISVPIIVFYWSYCQVLYAFSSVFSTSSISLQSFFFILIFDFFLHFPIGEQQDVSSSVLFLRYLILPYGKCMVKFFFFQFLFCSLRQYIFSR